MLNPPLLSSSRGALATITGPMFAGKTDRLIDEAQACMASPDRVLVVVPILDHRHGVGVIRTHAGRTLQPSESLRVVAVDTQQRAPLAPLQAGEHTVLIDEAQFFGPHVLDWAFHLVRLQVRVYAFGLELDYKAEPFGLMPELIQLANERVRLHARCARCQQPATRTFRKVEQGGQVLIGGADSYEPRCVPCWKLGHAADASAAPAA